MLIPPGTLHVFAYGSLMFEPLHREHLLGVRRAVLPHVTRRFSKRSTSRGCPDDHAAIPQGLPGWVEDGHRHSVVLALEPTQGVVQLRIRLR